MTRLNVPNLLSAFRVVCAPVLLVLAWHGATGMFLTLPLGIRDEMAFEAAHATAHTLACLRFAGPVTETIAHPRGPGDRVTEAEDIAKAGAFLLSDEPAS